MQYLLTQEELYKLKGETPEMWKAVDKRVAEVMEDVYKVMQKHGFADEFQRNKLLFNDLKAVLKNLKPTPP